LRKNGALKNGAFNEFDVNSKYGSYKGGCSQIHYFEKEARAEGKSWTGGGRLKF
jgi:hypothetical protein